MESLSIKLENCYGIGSFEHVFDYSKSNANLIYSPNGVMKTSLAKTFLKISEGSQPEEKIYNRTPAYDISIDGAEIESHEILVVEPFNPNYESKNISTLLVNADKKMRYDKIYKEIFDAKKKLITELNKLSKVRKDDIEGQLLEDLECSDIFEAIGALKTENIGNINYSKIQYKQVFDPKVIELLNDKEVKVGISEYITRYNELIENSSLFKKGVFNPIRANTISGVLKKEQFFEASHKVLLNGKDQAIQAHKELDEIIEKEKESILGDGNLKQISQKIIRGVKSIESFQDLLETFPEISAELANLNNFKKIIWGSYFQKNKELFIELLSLFESNKKELTDIQNEAFLEKTLWFEAQDIFKERFDVPFSLEINNHTDAILGTDSPNIVFSFKEVGEEKIEFNRGKLNSLDVLSVGERRAMYLLYVIFELKARQTSGQRSLIIIDDIADSFDYKNKYAIIEYLKELTEESSFRILVLTHNFDFYRTFQSRVLVGSAKWDNSFIAQKLDGSIKLLKGGEKNVLNPFDKWKKNYGTNDEMLISMIPFVRNLIEYKDGNSCEAYKNLTSMLHIKLDTYDLKLSHLEEIICEVIKDGSTSQDFEKDKLVINHIYETADQLCENFDEDIICLERKISLSIAIRLKAEEFMWSCVTDKTPINSSQTGKLFDRLVRENSTSNGNFYEIKKTLSQVVLMTSENIHINSFMYEPLMDMANHHLVTLYVAVKDLEWNNT